MSPAILGRAVHQPSGPRSGVCPDVGKLGTLPTWSPKLRAGGWHSPLIERGALLVLGLPVGQPKGNSMKVKWPTLDTLKGCYVGCSVAGLPAPHPQEAPTVHVGVMLLAVMP